MIWIEGSAVHLEEFQPSVQLTANAQTHGITNTVEACYVLKPDTSVPGKVSQLVAFSGGQLCSDPDAHLFFDQ